jgi:hypothetical protein
MSLVNCCASSFLRLHGGPRLRALDVLIDCTYENGPVPYASLRDAFRSMTSLRFLQLQSFPQQYSGSVVVALPDTVEHVDVSGSALLVGSLPPGLLSTESDTLDPRRFPLLRVLSTSRSPDASFVGLRALHVHPQWDPASASALAGLAQLQFASLSVVARTAPTLFRALADLPLLVALSVVFTKPSATNGDVCTWRVRAMPRTALPHLRRLSVRDPPSTLSLPLLPAAEVVAVACGSYRDRRVLWYGTRRTPWTADEHDAILRSQAMLAVANVLTADEHDSLCLLHCPVPLEAESYSLKGVPRKMCGLPFAYAERYSGLYCSCQLLTY